ncbi:TetR/AcrR family transcriptional regulator [Paenibacillus ehimensis]|uniref:TetR/AcrR family transcriptional regulator n=1 Tax=Paenibacillus ehimensis TaxID=79264 RepID=A0ABT8VKD6_9BACL|nr:TetR/AcrR family transcriptional regulator [Paenibacillus ehimensis]MDO3681450.1 TetR/AcrR family transcriptional regulator [Paenibacillus ehimensis]MEC0207524.1 TetR/AcrR family transcriptional regulator [Paenibacillus ehimensis]
MGRKSDARERLLETAARLVPERGYHGVGVQELCNVAGIKPGSFYYLFPSKQQLVIAVLEKTWEDTRNYIFTPIQTSNLSPLEKIREFFMRTCHLHAHRSSEGKPVLGCTFAVLGGELATQDQVINRKVQEIFSLFTGYFEEWITQAYEDELIALPKERIPDTAKALLCYTEGVALIARIHNDAETFSRMAEGALRLANPKK